jgi:hypothetical protein
MDNACWDRTALKEFRLLGADGTIQELRKDELQARATTRGGDSPDPLEALLRYESDVVTLQNGERYERIAWPELFD